MEPDEMPLPEQPQAMPAMEPGDALQVLAQAAAMAPLPRQAHQQVDVAIASLVRALDLGAETATPSQKGKSRARR